jgi:hypothetical protein
LGRGKLTDQLKGMEISAFSYSVKSCLNSVHNGLNSKTSRYVLSKQDVTEQAKNHLELRAGRGGGGLEGSKLPDHLEGAGGLRRLRVRAGLLRPQQRPREDARQRLGGLTP